MYSLYIQGVQVYDSSAIQHLAACSKVAQIISDRHDGAAFYARILDCVLKLSQSYRTTTKSVDSEKTRLGQKDQKVESEAEVMLPDARLHSLILRLQCLALALGCVPDIESIMQLGVQPSTLAGSLTCTGDKGLSNTCL
jgi:hypothetical protein